ncbi:MAG: NADH-quinone oxidoreductase subunit N [Myxococcales bacterium]|nr:MAG: NADH-quinone oxidoreductase subunit N [Myxococcales bacterium]
MDLGSVQSVAYSLPEGILAVALVLILMMEVLIRRKDMHGYWALLAVAGACAAGAMQAGGPQGWLFNRMVALDSFAIFFKIVLGLAAVGAVWMSLGSKELEDENPGEYYVILLACTLGMFYMASAANLLMAYLALEFVSQTSYILSGFLKQNRRSSEAALKYLIYGGVASGVMVYGMSLIFGLTGSLDYAVIGERLAAGEGNAPVIYVALVLILAGFGYKISMVPFHMWAPDVYEGAPLPVTAFLAVGSKAAGIAMLVRFFYPGVSSLGGDGIWVPIEGVDWQGLMIVVACVTMTLGNLAAIRQDNVKRLLAYSSVAHAGYMLMGFVALSNQGLQAMLFYVIAYYIMNLGAFAVLLMVLNRSGREDIEAFRGLAWRGGALPAVAMAIFLFSLAGLPPTAGFIGKFYLFAAIIKEHMYVLALVAGVNTAIGLYYYARIVRAMFLDLPAEGDPTMTIDMHNSVLVGALVVFTVVFGVYWAPVSSLAARSLLFIGG